MNQVSTHQPFQNFAKFRIGKIIPIDIKGNRSQRFLEKLPEVALPIYPRSCGLFTVSRGFRRHNDGRLKPMVHLLWCLKGEGWLDFETRSVRLGAGDFFALFPGTTWTARCDYELWRYRWLTFDGPNASNFLTAYQFGPEPVHVGKCPEAQFDRFEQYLHSLNLYAWRKMVAIIGDILAEAVEGGEELTPSLESMAVECCRAQHHKPCFNVDSLAESLHVSRTTLFRVFRRKLGQNPSEYITELRCTHAFELLGGTTLPLREVARESGFSDLAYFCKVMKRRYNKTPGLLRKST